MIKKLGQLLYGVSFGWNHECTTAHVKTYKSSLRFSILNILGAMAGGYLMKYNVLGYNIYFFYLAIFLFTCFFISHVYITIYNCTVINNILKHKDFDLKNPESDMLGTRYARFAVRAKALTPQIKPIWTIVGLILGYNLIQTPPQVEKNILDLIISPFEELEKNNKYIKKLTILTEALTERGITDDCMKINTIEKIKELEKQKADLVKSNYKLSGEIVDILKSNLIKKK